MILEQYSSTLNKWEEFILIFGFADDYTNCQIIQKAFKDQVNDSIDVLK